MNRYYSLILLFVILASCNQNHKNDKQTITVSILPQKFFVEKITGNLYDVNVMIPPGASHTTYEPVAKQVAELSGSFIYFKIGHLEFEKAWMNKFISVNSSMKVINLSENMELIQAPAFRHDDHFHASGIDPHIWLSPV